MRAGTKTKTAIKTKTNIKEGSGVNGQGALNHNQRLVTETAPSEKRQRTAAVQNLAGVGSLKIKSGLKAGTGAIGDGPMKP